MSPISSQTLLDTFKIPHFITVLEERFLVTRLYPLYESIRTVGDLAKAANMPAREVIDILSWLEKTIPELPVSWEFCKKEPVIFAGIYGYKRFALIKAQRLNSIHIQLPHPWLTSILQEHQDKKIIIVGDSAASSMSAALFFRESGYRDCFYLEPV